MKEKVYKIISIGIAIILIFCTLWSCGKIVNAAVPQSQIVEKHADTWSGYVFDVNLDGFYYTIQDSTAISQSNYLVPQFFYTPDREKFYAVAGTNVYTEILNNTIGLIIKPSLLNGLLTNFYTLIGITDDTNEKYFQSALYDSNDNFLGWCLNDISGCYYAGNNNNDNVDYTNNWPSTVDNHIDYYLKNNNDLLPDYFTFYPPSNDTIERKFYNNLITGTAKTYFETQSAELSLGLNIRYWHNSGINARDDSFTWGDRRNLSSLQFYGYVNPVQYLCNKSGDTAWYNTLKQYDCTNNEILASDIISMNYPSSSYQFGYDAYSLNDEVITQALLINLSSQTMTTTTYSGCVFGIMADYEYCTIMPFTIDKITFYRNANIKLNMDDNLYQAPYYTNDRYNSYDGSINDSFNTSMQNINNSVTNNSSIYETANNEFNNYYDNGVVETNNITNNVTNITNNYYTSNDPDNPNNPDNPDNPDDNSTLDEILRAILRFFNAIGDIIGTLLASIINLIDSVLEAIAGVMETLSGASDLFASLFAWIPEPVPQILGAGFGICLVCGIIKFIRG